MRRLLLLVWGVGMVAAALAVSGEAEATWPGENGQLVIESYGDLYLWDLASAAATRLTFDGDNQWPAFSPDGSRIAYGAGECGGWFDGSLLHPDGLDLWVMNADGGNQRPIGDDIGWNSHPTWSPDGSQIAFHALRDPFAGGSAWMFGDYDIWVMNADGTGQSRLASGWDWQTEPAWSPDGSKIAYLVGHVETLESEIWVMDADGSNQTRLASETGFDYIDISWSPDGLQIAFTRYEAVWEGGIPGDIYVMDADGTNKRNLTSRPASDGRPVWSPDGTTIAYRSWRNGSAEIWAMDADGGNQRNLNAPIEPEFFDWQRIPTTRFFDVPDTHTFYGDVEWLATEGITKGCNPPYNTMYCPDGQVTRGQMAAFLVRALGYSDDGGGNLFIDDDGSIFESDIDKLKTAGVTKGCNPPANTMYCPGDQVTRGQMAAFLVRALGYTDDGGGDLFVDDDDSIFEADIDKLKTAGVTLGCNPPDNTMYCPSSYVTRAQMAAFLHRALIDN